MTRDEFNTKLLRAFAEMWPRWHEKDIAPQTQTPEPGEAVQSLFRQFSRFPLDDALRAMRLARDTSDAYKPSLAMIRRELYGNRPGQESDETDEQALVQACRLAHPRALAGLSDEQVWARWARAPDKAGKPANLLEARRVFLQDLRTHRGNIAIAMEARARFLWKDLTSVHPDELTERLDAWRASELTRIQEYTTRLRAEYGLKPSRPASKAAGKVPWGVGVKKPLPPAATPVAACLQFDDGEKF